MNMSIEEYWNQYTDNIERLNTIKLYRQLNINIESYMIDWLIYQLDLKSSRDSVYNKNYSEH
ncbi:hypothetical protein D3O27_14460 [Listeria monocytogenes]|nr:hypothetical protein [Listeria monocytogenes]KXS60527.1 hypothetical protein AWJ01_05665 [Listeria monocytogenes]TYU88640.1 hypothetical protein FZX01_03770 [Listeria monocytogenes]